LNLDLSLSFSPFDFFWGVVRLGFELWASLSSKNYLQSRCPPAWATPPVHSALVIWGMGVSWTVCPDWPQTVILLISASQWAWITGMNRWCPAPFRFGSAIVMGLGLKCRPIFAYKLYPHTSAICLVSPKGQFCSRCPAYPASPCLLEDLAPYSYSPSFLGFFSPRPEHHLLYKANSP
jgi:hypothetical protein